MSEIESSFTERLDCLVRDIARQSLAIDTHAASYADYDVTPRCLKEAMIMSTAAPAALRAAAAKTEGRTHAYQANLQEVGILAGPLAPEVCKMAEGLLTKKLGASRADRPESAREAELLARVAELEEEIETLREEQADREVWEIDSSVPSATEQRRLVESTPEANARVDALLVAAREFWKGGESAVRWVEFGQELLVYTRGEYREVIMRSVSNADSGRIDVGPRGQQAFRQAADELRALGSDPEIARTEADMILVRLLRHLGADEVADTFEGVEAWYS
jgi:hypothetical protein